MKTIRFVFQMMSKGLGDPARLARGLVTAGWVCLMLAILFSLAAPVQAAPPAPTPTPVGGSTNGQQGVDMIVNMFKTLASLFIQVAFSLMFIVFAVGSVKNGLGAQVAHQFGISHRLSEELLNLAGGVVIFAIGLLTLTLVNVVMTQIGSHYGTDLTIPVQKINIR